MMTIKLVVGVVLVALYLFAWVMVVMLGLELRAPRRRDPMPLLVDGDSHANRGTIIRQAFTAEDDVDGEGARPSSLLPYYHHKPDRAYLLQLKYAVEKANEEAVRMYGPLPAGGLPAQKKTKPKAPYRDLEGNAVSPVQPIIEENDEMKLKEVAAAAMLTAGVVACNGAISATTGAFSTGTEVVAQTQGAATSNDGQSEDDSEDMPRTYWQTFKPQFRDSFDVQWRAAKTDEEKLAAINEEFVYQDKLMNDRYKALHGMLSEKDWKSMRDEQREWLAEMMDACDDSDGDHIGAADCKLYRTAVRASELDVAIALEKHRR